MKGRRRAEQNRRNARSALRRSDAGFSSSSSDEVEVVRPQASKQRMTAKEREADARLRRANELQARFSLSSYYKPQVAEPPPDLLEEMNAVVDPVSGNIVKPKRTRKPAVKKETMDRMLAEQMEADLAASEEESEDDVIRDNRAAIAARKKASMAQTAKRRGEAAASANKRGKRVKQNETPEEQNETPEEPSEISEKPSEISEKSSETPSEEKISGEIPTEKPSETPSEVKSVEQTIPTSKSKVQSKSRGRKPKENDAGTSNVKAAPSDSSESSDSDSYVPLAQRLKMKMQSEDQSSIIDELTNTKSVVPTTRKRRGTARTNKSSAEPAKRAKNTKKKDSDSSDDSLFTF